MYARLVKRPLDFFVAAVFLVLLSPLLLLIALVVRILIGPGVLFSQDRPGKDQQIFQVLKFRTMTSEKDSSGQLLPDELRITRAGQFLRETSLDELPSLVNVLQGNLSFVGPRPLLVKYLPLYSPEQSRRHNVTPGLTGWAQANGRNALSWAKKFELDVWYVDNQSFSLDTRILLMTVASVLRRSDVSAPGSATAHEFNGRN